MIRSCAHVNKWDHFSKQNLNTVQNQSKMIKSDEATKNLSDI